MVVHGKEPNPVLTSASVEWKNVFHSTPASSIRQPVETLSAYFPRLMCHAVALTEKERDMTPSQAAIKHTLNMNKISSSTRETMWLVHDSFVNHKERCHVEQSEAPFLLNAMRALFPVMIPIKHDDSTEFYGVAIDSADGYVWFSMYVPNDPSAICETCIADEMMDELDAFIVHHF